MSKVGANIQKYRTALGLSQTDLSELSGVAQSSLADIETGKSESPRGKTLEKIAEGLSRRAGKMITVQDLLAEEDAPGSTTMEYFWRARFAELESKERLAFEGPDAGARIAWCIRQMLAWLPVTEVSRMVRASEQDLTAMAAGNVHPEQALIAQLVEGAKIPLNWIKYGIAPPEDEDLRFVLKHREAGRFIKVIRRAMEAQVFPELLDEHLSLIIKAQGNNKPQA